MSRPAEARTHSGGKGTVGRLPAIRFAASLLALAAALPLSGCTRLTVESTPEGAAVLWSPNGVDSWRPWPPAQWGGDEESEEAPLTPFSDSGVYGDAVWITVEKEGYFIPLPQTAQLYTGRHERLSFELHETPQGEAQRMTAQGLVLYEGEWVDPQAEGLIQYEGEWVPEQIAFERRQVAQGLVLYEGEWVSPAVAKERFEEAQREKGLIPLKGRWVSNEVAQAESRIDERVARLMESNPDSLTPPKVIGNVEMRDAQVQIINSTPNPVQFLFSGPSSREAALGPFESYGITPTQRLILVPGLYNIVAVEQLQTDQAPSQGEPTGRYVSYVEQPLTTGFQYLFAYEGKLRIDPDELGGAPAAGESQ